MKSSDEKPDKETPPEAAEETAEERARRECGELIALCTAMSEKIRIFMESDSEYVASNLSLTAAFEEYETLQKNGKKTKKAQREVEKRHEDLNAYCFYRQINMLLLESPRAYACNICMNKQITPGIDGEPICKFYRQLMEGETD